MLLSLFPGSWGGLTGSDATVISNGSLSLTIIGPTYAFFSIDFSSYLARQALSNLEFPVLGAGLRLQRVTTGLFWVSPATSVDLTLRRVVGAAMVYGVVVALGLKLVGLKLGP